MWSSSRRPLSAFSRLHLKQIPSRYSHKGFARLDSLVKDIMAGTGNDSASAQSQLAQSQQQQQQQPDYKTWSTSSLIDRISELERQLQSQNAAYSSPSPNGPTTKSKHDPANITSSPAPSKLSKRTPAKMDPTKYVFRHIALKFAYLGQRYQGLEHANGNTTPLPTIEEEMWKALRRTRLIFPTDMTEGEMGAGGMVDDRKKVRDPDVPFILSWEGCEYSKAGRTDRGVSAFGQVIGVRVRSARKKRVAQELKLEGEGAKVTGEESTLKTEEDEQWDDIADELPYISLLNKALPEDIRVLAWCPHLPEGWDARFSCRERHYKYFFTQPAFSPMPGPLGLLPRGGSSEPPKYRDGWLDIDAMREAAKYYEGVHDFRNFCKVDTSKQIENFERIVYRSEIELLDPKTNPLGYLSRPEFQRSADPATVAEESQGSSPANSQVYVFNLQGSAFLWHQVRHMIGILFLVGQGLESPSAVRELLDVTEHPRKPMYEMASDAPLVLWNCVYPAEGSETREDAMEWVYAGDRRQTKSAFVKGSGKFGGGGVVEDLWAVWRQRKMDEILAGSLLDLVLHQGDQSDIQDNDIRNFEKERQVKVDKVFRGGEGALANGKYIPLMQKRKMDTVEVQNARYIAAKQRKTEREAQAEASNP
ncbi:pseudouridine synthase DEG1 [Aspergillus stella-maris]|uniref:pseudouridine synthase DEG1 n=1 Tax=Aspergillus stella-maris TaxID=1810926 RepID=UPI003CCDA675